MKSVNQLLSDLSGLLFELSLGQKDNVVLMKAQQLVGQIRWRLKND